MAQVRRASAAIPCRMVRFTRSIKAVFNRPEKPIACKEALRASAKPQTHHVRDTNQLAPPIAFFHLAVDQAGRHLPLAHVAPATTLMEPLAKVSREAHRSRG